MKSTSMEQVFDKIRATTKIDGKTLTERALKTGEEFGELSEAVLSSQSVSGTGYKKKTKDDVVEEAIDVVICALSCVYQVKPDMAQEELGLIFNKKLDKWHEKCSKI
jgi:NTP pyrophosphatase (non-canonical NTP hydrolase)